MSFPRLFEFIRLFALLCLTSIVAAAQNNVAPSPPGAPTIPCDPSGAPDFASLRVFNGTAPVPRVYDCGSHGNSAGVCFTQLLDLARPEDYQGDLIAPGATQGAWTCAMVGGWSGWIPTNRLAPVPATPAITTQQWLGTWINTHVGTSRDRLVLTRSAAGQGRIHVAGKAYFTNAAHNVNFGGVSGEALAMGPFLHILDHGENDACVLDLKYNVSSDTFRAVDNQQCGGFNVSFNGVWRRASNRSRQSKSLDTVKR
ncbi:hypothetical protein AB4Y89_00195 [Terriglobus sp. 2YAB30_2]|uniref:hypothetical protein n=1 Tax=unclassified Terriglobus TaxID=2628988 RepID=UPI003F9A5A43